MPQQFLIPEKALEQAKTEAAAKGIEGDRTFVEERTKRLSQQALAVFLIAQAEATGNPVRIARVKERNDAFLPKSPEEKAEADAIVALASDPAATKQRVRKQFGLLGHLGVADALSALDDSTRSNFMPYGLSGVIFGAAMVFFAFIGFDSISTHAEEAINPQRDLPFGILASLALCTVLYLGVSAIITGMVPYPDIDTRAAVASAFSDRAQLPGAPATLTWASALVALGGLAGMTSVLLITFLSQARVFLAMARDGLLPHSIFGVVHDKYRTPARSTILTGLLMMLVAGFTPIATLEEMVNIGTLFAFVVVCASVWMLRIRRPDAARPFRCPALHVVAPCGIAVNVLLMLVLPLETWGRLIGWLTLGLVIYFCFGFWNSTLHRGREATAKST
jgi:APA family basic amino acid/polyamine antiporter